MRIATLVFCMSLPAIGCNTSAPSPSAEPQPRATTAAPAASSASAPIPPRSVDPALVEATTGLKPEVTDGVVKVAYPRNEVKVEIDQWAMPPFMGLTSWAGFTPGGKPGIEAMVMGDLVLFGDEVSEVMRAALSHGISVTALHNHFLFDKPHVYFMHIEGEGKAEDLGKGLRSALDAMKAVRAKAPSPTDRFEAAALPPKSSIDGAKIEAVIGAKGTSKDGMYKVVVGRPATHAACGCAIGKAMGVNTWAAFAGAEDNAVVDGDFAVTEDELQPVLKSLTASGIHVVAIHHHMVGEQPRILFLHYWGRGPAAGLAGSVKKALDLTKTSG
jgi:hypothetical protein